MVLFVYGSLMAEEVLKILLSGRVPKMTPAVLANYARHPVAGACFPAIVARAGASVEGRLLDGLSARDLSALDYFEDEEYEVRSSPPARRGRARVCVAVRQGAPADARHFLSYEFPGRTWPSTW